MVGTNTAPKNTEHMDPYLTTEDNPYDPRDEFNEWYAFDRWQGYNTVELLDRCHHNSDILSPADQKDSLLAAMEEIVEYNLSGVHKIVGRPP